MLNEGRSLVSGPLHTLPCITGVAFSPLSYGLAVTSRKPSLPLRLFEVPLLWTPAKVLGPTRRLPTVLCVWSFAWFSSPWDGEL